MSDKSDPFKLYRTSFIVPTSSIMRPMTEEDRLRSQIEQLRAQISNQEATLQKIQEKPTVIVTVLAKTSETRGIIVGQAVPGLDVNLPSHVKVGTQLRVPQDNQQPLSALERPLCFGAIVVVSQVVGDHVLFEQVGNQKRSAVIADDIEPKPRSGDEVRLDPTGYVALENLGPATAKEDFDANSIQEILWSDIGGLEDAKEMLREVVEYPISHAELYREYGQRTPKGALLYGPPGGGKTLLGKAVSCALARSRDTAPCFIYVKGPEVLSMWHGNSEGNVRRMFEQARAYKRKTGNIAVIFIDEADALLAARGSNVPGSGMSATVVPQFLAEMDGLDDAAALVLLATNRPEILDPAVMRKGRIDRRVFVSRPDRSACKQILDISLRGRKCPDPEAFSAGVLELAFSDELTLFELLFADDGEPDFVRLRDAMSGALVAGIVDSATEIALRRDRESGNVSGISPEDGELAVHQAFRELALDGATSVSRELDAIVKERAHALRRPLHAVKRTIFNAKDQPAITGPEVEGDN